MSKVTAGNGQVTATWSPPASDGGSPIVRYQVTGSPDVVAVSVSAPTITATLTGLPNGTSECVQVQALNAVGGGPLSPAGQSCATPVPPAAVPNRPPSLSVSDGNGSLTISWGAASVGLGSPPVTHYELSVNGGGSQPAVSPTTIGATAWATEQISVYAVNAVGNGAAAAATGVAWNRQPAVICFNATSGDRSIRDACDQANNFQQQGNAGFDIVEANPNSGHAQPSAFNERLCTGYYTANQGDHYALLTSPSQNCPTALAGAQNPAVAHTIAFVSSGSLGDSDSRHICEYTGQTSGTQGTFTQQELSPCGSPPPGMTGAVQGFDFWT
ncbi:MAG: fibronectin type III domain-containing protein [Acidimicrobiaceae bacterium]|nr:fibronectin type III domain-containing protein [Acidimicrobiaceae bacterium]